MTIKHLCRGKDIYLLVNKMLLIDTQKEYNFLYNNTKQK